MVAGRRKSWEAGNTTSGTALLCRKRRPHLQHSKELLFGDLQAIVVGGVHHENQSIRVGVVAPPVGANARLPAEVPHLEFDVLVLQGLYVEPDGRDRLFDLTCLQPVCRSEGGVCGRRGANVSGSCVRGAGNEAHANSQRIVVLPALSKPSTRMRASPSFLRRRRSNVNKPCLRVGTLGMYSC